MPSLRPVAEQLTFDFHLERPDAPLAVTEANRLAVALAEGAEVWPLGAACLCGPRGAGKTRLARECFDGAPIAAEALAPSVLERVGPGVRLVLDDIDAGLACAFEPSETERLLFHLLNLVAECGARLLLTGRAPPARWGVRLPDLRTRLHALPLAVIAPPDDGLLAAILQARFNRYGVDVEPEVIAYLVRRVERSFEAAEEVADRLNAASRRAQARISRPFAAKVLDAA